MLCRLLPLHILYLGTYAFTEKAWMSLHSKKVGHDLIYMSDVPNKTTLLHVGSEKGVYTNSIGRWRYRRLDKDRTLASMHNKYNI